MTRLIKTALLAAAVFTTAVPAIASPYGAWDNGYRFDGSDTRAGSRASSHNNGAEPSQAWRTMN